MSYDIEYNAEGDEIEDFEPEIINVCDDEGNEYDFEVLDKIEDADGNSYIAMTPLNNDPEGNSEEFGELVVMKIVTEDGEDIFVSIDDEDELNSVYDIFIDRLSDMFEFEQ